MRLNAPWLATSALLALTALATPSRSHAQAYVPEVDILVPGPDGVLRLDLIAPRCGRRCVRSHAHLDDGEISRAYLHSLERRRPRKAVRPERHRFAQDVLRPPGEISRTDAPRNDPPRVEPPKADDASGKLRDEVQRLSSEMARMRSEADALRESVGKLTSETAGLRGEIGALREQLAKQASETAVTGKPGEPPRPSEPLRKQDSLKGGADEKFAERPPTSTEGIRKPDDSFTDTIARAWRRVRDMIGRPGG